nr:flagellar protein FlgN [Priestia taiwanensis]
MVQNLTKQVEEHEALLLLATNKTDIVKSGEIEALEKTMKQEQRHVLVMQKLEAERKEIVYRLMSGRPFEGAEPTLSECIEVIEGQGKTELLLLMSKLIEVVRQVKQVNELNQALLSQSLQFVNMTLSATTQQEPPTTYSKNQEKQPKRQPQSMFNVQA